MYLNIGQSSPLGNIGGFTDFLYWSSTEIDSIGAFAHNFVSGLPTGDNKQNGSTNLTRAIRAF